MTTAEISKLTDKQIIAEQEKLDKERQKIRAKGRMFKEEIDRRAIEGTIISKLRAGKELREHHHTYLAGLSKSDVARITKAVTGDTVEKISEAVKSSKSKKST